MKKLIKGLTLLLSGFAIQSYAAVPTGIPNGCVNVPRYCGGTTFGLTAFFWRPSVTSLNYALVYPNIDDASNTIFQDGVERSIRAAYTWGLKINIGYIYPCSGNDVVATLTHFGRDDRRVATDPDDGNLLPSISDTWRDEFIVGVNIPEITGVAGGTTVTLFPAQTIFTPPSHADVAAAKTSFDYTAFDLDFGQQINVGCNLKVHWHGGLRYAELDNKLNVTIFSNRNNTVTQTAIDTVEDVPTEITFAATTNITEYVNQKSYFQGVGPRFGLDSTYHLACGFGLVGDLSTGLIIGKQHDHFLEEFNESGSATIIGLIPGSTGDDPTTDFSAGLGTVFTSTVNLTGEPANRLVIYNTPRVFRVVPNLEAKLGLNYTFQFCNCSRTQVNIEAGWLGTHYFNLMDRTSLVSSHSPEFRTYRTISMGFQGPYIGVQVNL